MDCPLCGKEIRRGQAAYVPTGGLYFLPPGYVQQFGLAQETGRTPSVYLRKLP